MPHARLIHTETEISAMRLSNIILISALSALAAAKTGSICCILTVPSLDCGASPTTPGKCQDVMNLVCNKYIGSESATINFRYDSSNDVQRSVCPGITLSGSATTVPSSDFVYEDDPKNIHVHWNCKADTDGLGDTCICPDTTMNC